MAGFFTPTDFADRRIEKVKTSPPLINTDDTDRGLARLTPELVM